MGSCNYPGTELEKGSRKDKHTFSEAVSWRKRLSRHTASLLRLESRNENSLATYISIFCIFHIITCISSICTQWATKVKKCVDFFIQKLWHHLSCCSLFLLLRAWVRGYLLPYTVLMRVFFHNGAFQISFKS